MSTENVNKENSTSLGRFLDNIWLQFLIATILTVAWQLWIAYEIIFRS